MIIPVCPPTDEITTRYAYHFSHNIGPHGDYREPANTWIDSASMADFLRDLIEKKGRQALVSERGFQCSPRPVADCPDCLACSRIVRGVRNHHCQHEGDMFIEAYVGPHTNVRAMTYWRK
ncbi:MAG: hypothetical protein A3D94_11450 [Alphaproteobacteria bacterium RIFCSPHIGHO2_12_FULL_66_14]|nr:MAG: hypothetical protein A3D94_11450 [Alphaproteobacteria bacterium RIFCSPHIGHO2_12_FULL_66_14]